MDLSGADRNVSYFQTGAPGLGVVFETGEREWNHRVPYRSFRRAHPVLTRVKQVPEPGPEYPARVS